MTGVEQARKRFIDADERHLRSNKHEDWVAWQKTGAAYWALQHPEVAHIRNADSQRVLSLREIDELAELLRRSMDGVPATWRLQPWSDERVQHSAQVTWFHELMSALYGRLWRAFEQLRAGKIEGLEPLLRFLEADPYCFRSGYAKAEIIHLLTQLDLDDTAQRRLEGVLFSVLEKPTRREFRKYVRLARYLDSVELRQQLTLLSASRAQPTRRHARWLLEGLDAADPTAAGSDHP